jgi:L-lactate utilization protein LutB
MTGYQCLVSCPYFYAIGKKINGKTYNQCFDNCSSTNSEFTVLM